jgi:tungstate transport system substrate-binding protein
VVTTHSVEDSGLLDTLATAFHAAHPRYRLTTTAVGSGAALELGRRGDADLLFTHDPVGERRFMDEGHSLEQARIMENHFLIVGPPTDPAGIGGMTGAVAALRAVAASGSRFLSRGDDSGTHRKERALWAAAGLEPWETRPSWYIEAGLGMAETLQTGSELEAYLLTDAATFRNQGGTLRLAPLIRSDPDLANPYSYTIPRRQRNPGGARVLADWLMVDGQAVIARYGVERFGEPLFRPAGGRPASSTGGPDGAP